MKTDTKIERTFCIELTNQEAVILNQIFDFLPNNDKMLECKEFDFNKFDVEFFKRLTDFLAQAEDE